MTNLLNSKNIYYLLLNLVIWGYQLPSIALDISKPTDPFDPNSKAQVSSRSQVNSQTINNCPREFTGWKLIKTFETASYSLALCRQGNSNYLVGHEKGEHEAFIQAKVVSQFISQGDNFIVAQDEQGFTYEVDNYQLNVSQNNKLIAQEKLIHAESNLTGGIWQLQQIRYNNDELIEIDNPANYTIEFLPDGQVQIKADCNNARGSYTQKNSSISIQIGPSTRAMCPPESQSDRYLQELQSAVIFFFQDGNLYFDLKFDTGTMKFIQSNNTGSDSKQASDRQNSARFTGPGSVENQLEEDAQVTETVFPGIDRTFKPWFDWKEKVNQDIGLNFGVDYNFLYQNLTDSLGEDDATGGIFRAFGTWTLVGRDTNKPGSLVFKVENRHRFGSVAPQNLGFEAGYVGITGTQFSDYGWGLTNLYWQQKFNQGKLAFLIGKVDVTDYLDVYGLINPLTHFQNLSFSTNPTIAAPNQGLGASFGAMLSDNIYLVTGFADANGDPTELGFDTFFDEGEFFKHIEVGWTSSQDRIYLDNIHLTAWHSDSIDDANLPSSWGLAFSAAWFINDRWMPFLRGGYSEGESALLEGNVSAGVGRYFSNSKNLLGVGLGWGQPTDSSLESQVTSEVFYRLQIAENWAITPDIQLLFNPALNPDEDTIAVFGIRSRLNF